MAAKTLVLGIFVAILAGNRGYRACGDRYGQHSGAERILRYVREQC